MRTPHTPLLPPHTHTHSSSHGEEGEGDGVRSLLLTRGPSFSPRRDPPSHFSRKEQTPSSHLLSSHTTSLVLTWAPCFSQKREAPLSSHISLLLTLPSPWFSLVGPNSSFRGGEGLSSPNTDGSPSFPFSSQGRERERVGRDPS